MWAGTLSPVQRGPAFSPVIPRGANEVERPSRNAPRSRAIATAMLRTPLLAPTRSHSISEITAHPSTTLGMTCGRERPRLCSGGPAFSPVIPRGANEVERPSRNAPPFYAIATAMLRTPLLAPTRSHSIAEITAHPSTTLGMTCGRERPRLCSGGPAFPPVIPRGANEVERPSRNAPRSFAIAGQLHHPTARAYALALDRGDYRASLDNARDDMWAGTLSPVQRGPAFPPCHSEGRERS
jgi:hypothetical protein